MLYRRDSWDELLAQKWGIYISLIPNIILCNVFGQCILGGWDDVENEWLLGVARNVIGEEVGKVIN